MVLIFSALAAYSVSAKAQSAIVPVPAYQTQAEIPGQISAEEKMLQELPFVVIKGFEIDYTSFNSEMEAWIPGNQSTIKGLSKDVQDLIAKKSFNELAQLLVDNEHYKMVSATKVKGGKYE